MIHLTKKTLYLFLFLLTLLMDVSILLNKSFIFSSLSLIFLITLPGVLTLMALRVKNLPFWNYIVTSIGLSISVLMIVGLIFNWVWFASIHTPPLTKPLMFALVNVYIFVLTLVGYFRKQDIQFKFKFEFRRVNVLNTILFILPVIFTLLSIFGAIILNNGGGNIFTMTALAGIAVFSCLILFTHKRIPGYIFPYGIFLISLSLLLMLSLRSWYISGWDIQDENRLFQLTKDIGYWSPNNIQHDYNSCLSITLLPTIFNLLTGITIEGLFKIVYQVIFSLLPVSVYLIARRYSTSALSYFASFYIMIQPFYIQPMVALMRQEIAFAFFGIMLLTIFEENLNSKVRSILVIIFGISLIMSHYSTTYIALILLMITYLGLGTIRIIRRWNFVKKVAQKLKLKSQNEIKHSYFISPLILFVLFSYSLVWYSVVNSTAKHATQVAQDFIQDMDKMFHAKNDNEDTRKAVQVLPDGDINKVDQLNEYIENQVFMFQSDLSPKYPRSVVDKYTLAPLYPSSADPAIKTSISSEINIFFQLFKQPFKIFVFIGVFLMLFMKFKNSVFHREFIILAFVSAMLIAIMILNPSLTASYNLSRFYLQSLVILSLPAILGTMFFFTFLRKLAFYAMGASLILLYLFFSGFTSQIFGGEAYMHLNNYGDDYDKFYMHQSEIVSGDWLAKHRYKNTAIFADGNASLRLRYTSWTDTTKTILPQVIYKNSYVYASYTNIVENRTYASFNGNVLRYEYPQGFLSDNKDVIYNNGSSKIYK